MTPYLTWETVHLLLPELLVGSLAVAIYVGGTVVPSRVAFNVIAVLGLITAGWLLVQQENRLNVLGGAAPMSTSSEDPVAGESRVTSGPLLMDPLAQLIRFGVLAIGLLLVAAAWRAGSNALATEYLGSLLLAICGSMLVATANELVLLFVAFELISIPTYILLFLGRANLQSQEAATKYFLLSVLSSSLFLFGLSLLYGVAGTTQLAEMKEALALQVADDSSLLYLAPAALVLVIAGLSFKIAAVPFHFYAPDVYQGTTAGNAGLLAILPKIAGIVGLVRIVIGVAPAANLSSIGWQMLLSIAVVTMTLGNVLALWQNNLRRMMAYSSIAHAGYMLVGLAVAMAGSEEDMLDPSSQGLSAALFYLGVYTFATLGTFAVLGALATSERELDHVDELSGLVRTQPTIAVALAVCMFSLIGIPPLAGFWGKFRLVSGALSLDAGQVDPSVVRWFCILAVITVINAAISTGYYLRIVGVLFFGEPAKETAESLGGPRFAALMAAIAIVVMGIAPGQFWASTDRAATSILHKSQMESLADTQRAFGSWAVTTDATSSSR